MPEGRRSVTTVDGQGRVAKTELTGLHPTRQEYDPQGRVAAVKEGRTPTRRRRA